jgi:FkbM family methyltransferase
MPSRGLKGQVRRLLPRTLGSHRILSGPLRGYRIVTSWHDYPAAILGRTERRLLEWFERHVRPGETWLDVGAHYGYTAIALSRLVGARGRVFAFEPDLATAGCVSRTRDLNGLRQLTVVPVALGAPESIAAASLPRERGMVDLTASSDDPCPFLIARLDWIWERVCGGLMAVHGIKIDVQGMELEALRGMMRVLRESGPKLVVELHRGVDRSAFLRLIESLGYPGAGEPIDPEGVHSGTRYLDDRSYAFIARPAPASAPS